MGRASQLSESSCRPRSSSWAWASASSSPTLPRCSRKEPTRAWKVVHAWGPKDAFALSSRSTAR